MKLCVNYLMELRELFNENDLDYLDYIKLYSINGDLSPFDWCISKKDVMFHGFVGKKGSSIGDADFFENRNFDEQIDYYTRGKTPYISAHIHRTSDYGQDEEQMLQTISYNVKKLKELFNMRVILENVPVHKEKMQNVFFSMPEFICRAVRDNDCGFLFDIGHARAAAYSLNIPFEEYVERLPMDRLVEVHLAGAMRLSDGSIVANHSKMNEEDYEFIKSAIDKYKTLEVVTLEYGTVEDNNPEGLCNDVLVDGENVNLKAKADLYEQLERLKKIVKN